MSAVDELIEEFSDLDQHEACQYLEELGRDLPEIPESVYVDENLVPGCQSRVWLNMQAVEPAPDKVTIQADSDALVVKGLVFIVLEMYDGRTPQEVMDIEYVGTFDRLGLGRLILPQRKNGLYSMVRTIREFAARQLGVASEDDSNARAVSRTPVVPTLEVDGIAKLFPILQTTLPNGKRPVFLDSGASAQKPQSVIAAEREVEEQYYANAFRGRYYFGQRVDDEIESTREKAAELIGAARTDEVVFTSGTTMSINLVALAWGRQNLGAGDEVVITEMEHHANFVPWQAVASQTGATLRILPITDEGLLDPAAIDATINKKTKMVAVCSMSNVLGTVNPIDRLTEQAHAVGALILVDAAQSVPHQPIDVSAAGIDFLAFSGHKLYGPSGVGVLYGRHELLLDMDPLLYGGHMIQQVGRESSSWSEPPAKFEAGTMPIVQIIGMGAAIDFIKSIGYPALQAHEHDLVRYAHARLGQIAGLTIYGPPVQNKGAIVSFTIDGISTEDLAHRLDQHGVFTRHGHHCTMVLHERLNVPATTRASFGVYNTTDDIEVLANAIESAIADLR